MPYINNPEYTEIAFGLYRITSLPKALQPFVPIVEAGEVVSL
jgi:hypothetical protein